MEEALQAVGFPTRKIPAALSPSPRAPAKAPPLGAAAVAAAVEAAALAGRHRATDRREIPVEVSVEPPRRGHQRCPSLHEEPKLEPKVEQKVQEVLVEVVRKVSYDSCVEKLGMEPRVIPEGIVTQVAQSSQVIQGFLLDSAEKKFQPPRRKLSVRRRPSTDLPLLHEERILDSNLQVTFLLPIGPVGAQFAEGVRAGFMEADEDTPPGRSILQVPYAGNKIALVTLWQIGPLEALEHARRRSQGSLCERENAPLDTSDEMSALSSALIYVVHRDEAIDCMEQQLGPICAVEASFGVMQSHQPRRFVVAVQDSQEGDFGETILKDLEARRVSSLQCMSVVRGDPESHRAVLVQVVETLAAHFQRVSSPAKRPSGAAHVNCDRTEGFQLPETDPEDGVFDEEDEQEQATTASGSSQHSTSRGASA